MLGGEMMNHGAGEIAGVCISTRQQSRQSGDGD